MYTKYATVQQSIIPYPIVNVINPFICYKIAKLNRIPMLSCCAPLNTAVIQSQYHEQNKSWQQKIRQYCTQLLFARSQAWLTRTISAYLALFGLPMAFLAKILALQICYMIQCFAIHVAHPALLFLAVHNSSIGDLVTHSLSQSVTFTIWH